MNVTHLDDGVYEILAYWFGVNYWNKAAFDNKSTTQWEELWVNIWFAKNEKGKEVDKFIEDNFQKYVTAALNNELDHWYLPVSECFVPNENSTLALIIVLDQFTRNIYRSTEKAWAGDQKALEVCKYGINSQIYRKLHPIAQAMFFMPLLHSENLSDQEESVTMFRKLVTNNFPCPGQSIFLKLTFFFL